MLTMLLSSLNVILNPVTLSCGHSGCEKCLATLARFATPKCHRCRTPFTANGLKLNVIMDTMTRDLKVKCLSGGCEWSGIYPEAEDHYNECPKLEEKCKNEHCTHVRSGNDASPRGRLPETKAPVYGMQTAGTERWNTKSPRLYVRQFASTMSVGMRNAVTTVCW